MTTAKTYPGINLGNAHPEADAQAETTIFGFWVFLMSDLIIFGLLFATFLTMTTAMGQAGGPSPSDIFSLERALLQTGILLTSSFTFGLASLALVHHRGYRKVVLWLSVTMFLGFVFLGLSATEFNDLVGRGLGPTRSGYLSAYYGLVGTHAIHVTAGLVWIAITLIQVRLFQDAPVMKTRILRLGLFWHFLDVVWIAVVSAVYLGAFA